MHKLLTGRHDFGSLRQRDGLSGYPSRAESEHDVIENSHASTALSYADGLAKAYALRGEARHVYHLFTVRHAQRDAFAKALADLGVGTGVYYPLAAPNQPMFGGDERRFPEAWRAAREVLSLPCFAELGDEEVDTVAAAARKVCEPI